MRKELVILSLLFCLASGNFSTANGQKANLAERLVVAEVDTVHVKEAGAASDQVAADHSISDQSVSDRVARIWEEIEKNGKEALLPADAQHISPWSFNTNIGTSYSYFPRFGSAMNMYAAPQLNFSATDRLAFHAGVMVGRTVPVTGLLKQESPVNTGMTNMSTYVAGSYRLTENLVLHGSGTRSVLLVPGDGELQSMNFNDLSIGATYNFGNFSIGATIHRSDAPLYNSPFGTGSMFGAPLYW